MWLEVVLLFHRYALVGLAVPIMHQSPHAVQ